MSKRVRRRTGCLRSLLYAMLMLVSANATAQEVVPASTAPMVLDISINGTHSGELLFVERSVNGGISAKASDLRRLRIRLAPELAPDAMVRLDTLPGVVVNYDEPNQALALHVPDNLLEPYAVSLGGQERLTDLDKIQIAPAAILNYDLYHTYQHNKSYLSGNAEMLLTGRAGIFSTTALYNEAQISGYEKTVRLDSSWRYINPQTVRSYTLGDFASNALSWSNSVRLAGFQWASAFEQRSDIVTTALPQFSGSAGLPSTLDLYVNQQRIFSGQIPSGPFDLRSLPYVSGNEVTFVTTDATGRQITTTQAYYYTASLLRQGLTQFSVDVGVPRFNYGLKSSDYDHTLFASAVARYGLSNTTTLEGHSEASGDGLVNLGLGAAQGLGGRGVITSALSVSRYKNYTGTRTKLGAEGQLSGLRLYASTERNFGDYFNLARVSAVRFAHRDDLANSSYGTWLINTAQANTVDRAGISFSPFARTSVNLSYNHIKYPNEDVRTANLSISRSLSQRISLFANAYSDLSHSGQHGFYLTLNIALDGNINASTSINRDSGRTSYNQRVSGITGQRQGEVGWGLSNTIYEGGNDLRNAYVSYRAAQALLRARVDQYGSSTRTELQAEGSVVMGGGGVFAANKIGDAYAIVTNAGPNVEVLQGGVKMGRTDQNGRALLPNLRPYYEQHVFIDPATLPDGWEPEVTERIATAGYRQGAVVDFGTKVVHGAVLILYGKDGKPLPAGYSAHLEGGESSIVGYDGQLYVRGLLKHNRVTVDLGPGGHCATDFAYDPRGSVQPQIGPLVCE